MIYLLNLCDLYDFCRGRCPHRPLNGVICESGNNLLWLCYLFVFMLSVLSKI